MAVNVHSYLNSYPVSATTWGILELRDVKAKNPNGPNPFINNALWRAVAEGGARGRGEIHRRREGEGSESDRRTSFDTTPIANSQLPGSWLQLAISSFIGQLGPESSPEVEAACGFAAHSTSVSIAHASGLRRISSPVS